MKTPRLDDFAQTPTRPIQELHSPLDDMPRIEKPPRYRPDTAHQPGDIAASSGRQTVASPPRRIAGRRTSRPAGRPAGTMQLSPPYAYIQVRRQGSRRLPHSLGFAYERQTSLPGTEATERPKQLP